MSETDTESRRLARNAVRRVDRARRFPTNTCSASRHVQLIGETLAAGKGYAMIEEEPEYVAGSLLITVEALYKARTELAGGGEIVLLVGPGLAPFEAEGGIGDHAAL